MNKIILSILLSVICGIVLGLYLKNIALVIFLILIFFYIFLCLKKIELPFNKNYIIYLLLISFTVFSLTYFADLRYENLYSEDITYFGTAEVISFAEEKDYTNKYTIKIKNLNKSNKYKNTKLFIYVSKNTSLEYGDVIFISGNFERADSKRNDKGFDYERYLRQSRVYGIFDVEGVEVVNQKRGIVYHFYKFRNDLIEKLYNMYDEEEAGFLAGILLRR